MNVTDAIHIERPKTDSKDFCAHAMGRHARAGRPVSPLLPPGDVFPFPYTPLWVMLIMGFVYAPR